jgi:RNA polymerase sigma factor (sigma-70 family)
MNPCLPVVVRQIRALAQPPRTDERSDRQLLRHFATTRDEAAFATVVCRHGRMVLGVCRRVLRHEQDAEDAFQATFLVLARRAASVRWHGSAGGWLYRVARRVAGAARDRAARRRARERTCATLPDVPAPAADPRELGALLDEELARLPERYRAPLVLCYLEGTTRDQAARRLGLSLRTLDRRLQHGRETLRRRLMRRGLTLSAGFLAATMTERTTAAVMPGLTTATARAAALFAAGDAGAAPAPVMALAQGLLKSALVANVRNLALVLLVLAAAGAGAGLLCRLPAAPQVDATPEEKARTDATGDPLPSGALARLGTVRWHHGEALSHLRFSADGKQLITAGPDGLVRVWEVATGKELHRLGRATNYPRRPVALTPDGNHAALAEPDGTVCVWDVAAGKEALRLATGHKEGVIALTLSPDGKRLASRGLDRTVIAWDVGTGKELRRLGDVGDAGCSARPAGGGETLLFSPDGTTLAVSSVPWGHEGAGVRLWDVTTGKERARIPYLTKESGEEPRERPAAFSPDGKLLARVLLYGVVVYETATGKELRCLSNRHTDMDGNLEQATFSPDGKRLALFTDEETAYLFDVETGKSVRDLGPAPARWPHDYKDADGRRLAFSPDGKLLAQVWHGNSVRLCDVDTAKARSLHAGHTGPVLAAAFQGDGVLTFGADAMLRCWRADTGEEVARRPIPGLPPPPRWGGDPLGIAADGRTVAIDRDDGLCVVDVASGEELHRWARNQQDPASWELFSSLKPSPSGNLLVALDNDQRFHVRDVATGKEYPVPAEQFPADSRPRMVREIVDYALSPDGRSLFAVSVPGYKAPAGAPKCTLRLWDVATGRLLQQSSSDDSAGPAAFAPDGRTVALATPKYVVLWETVSGRERGRLPAAGGVPAFSTDGRLLAVGGPDAVRVWDVRGGKELDRLTGHTGTVLWATFSPDGRRLLTASADSTALIWDADRLRRRLTPPPADLTAEQVEALWNDLAGADAGQAFRAVVGLGGAPGRSVPWLRDHLKPVTDGKDLERLRQVRAVEALEQAGTPEGRRLLEDLAGGEAEAPLTREARAALDRIPRK